MRTLNTIAALISFAIASGLIAIGIAIYAPDFFLDNISATPLNYFILGGIAFSLAGFFFANTLRDTAGLHISEIAPDLSALTVTDFDGAEYNYARQHFARLSPEYAKLTLTGRELAFCASVQQTHGLRPFDISECDRVMLDKLLQRGALILA